jgi:hypothetical protein
LARYEHPYRLDAVVVEALLAHLNRLINAANGATRGEHGDMRVPLLNLLYLSTSFLWWQAVAGIIRVTLSTALRSNSWGTWRHREGSRNVHHTAIRRALSPSRPCGSVTAGVHG